MAGKTRNRFICIRVQEGFHRALTDEALRAGVSRSRFVRIVVGDELRRRIQRRRLVDKHLGGNPRSSAGSPNTAQPSSPSKEPKA